MVSHGQVHHDLQETVDSSKAQFDDFQPMSQTSDSASEDRQNEGEVGVMEDHFLALMDAADEYVRAQESLSEAIKTGFFSLTQAKYTSLGVSHILQSFT